MFSYKTNCVSWDPLDIDSLQNIIDNAIEITRRTFLKHTFKEEISFLESSLGYAKHYKQGLTMFQDWCVSYHRSKCNGRRCYFFCHSAIEYLFFGDENAN